MFQTGELSFNGSSTAGSKCQHSEFVCMFFMFCFRFVGVFFRLALRGHDRRVVQKLQVR